MLSDSDLVTLGAVVLMMSQLLLLLMKNSMDLCLAQYRAAVRRRRAYTQLFLQSSQKRRYRLRLGSSRRQRLRERWFALHAQPQDRQYWVFPQSSDWWDRIVMRYWDQKRWVQGFRMSRETFFELVDLLRPTLERETTNMRRPISVEKRVAVAIWFLASGASFRLAREQFGIGLSTAATAVMEVCFAMEVKLLSKTVCLGDSVLQIMRGFEELGFPHCVGAIDGSHIPICAPGGNPDQYGNRKKFSSIILQGTVDHRGRFVDIETGWSGKNHDAFVFRNSALCAAMDSGKFVPGNPTVTINGVQVPPLIIADGAYPMRRWLIKPYGNEARTARDRHFDRCLSKARNVVECAFGRLKSRWRCLSTRLNAREKNVISITAACVILHNICEQKGYPVLSERRDPTPLVVGPARFNTTRNNPYLNQGKEVREALANHLFGVRS